MRFTWVALLAAASALAACGGLGETGDEGSDENGKVTISWLVDNSEQTLKPAEALAKAFTATNPNITVKIETRPQGGDGDNVVKTRLATGEMTDVFMYNSGSLFQALSPEKNLVPLTDQPWVERPRGRVQADGVGERQALRRAVRRLDRRRRPLQPKVYEQLGLEVPKTWAEFMANNAKLKAEGIAPVIQTYQETWTSQLLRPGQPPQRRRRRPGLGREVHDEPGEVRPGARRSRASSVSRRSTRPGFENKDYRSAKFDEGLRELADGQGRALPDADRRGGHYRDREPAGDRRHRVLRAAGRRRGQERADAVDAGRRLHPEDDRGRQARRGQEVRGLRGEQGGLRRPDEGVHAVRVRT